MSLYRIRIVRADGRAVDLRPGREAEQDLIAAVTRRAVAQGVGIFKTEKQVAAAIESALRDVLLELKSDVLP